MRPWREEREFGVRKEKFGSFESVKDRKSKRRRKGDTEGLALKTIRLGFGLYDRQH